ncbi:gas vesicle protein [Halalkalibacillus sediminis]|uniref:Gas vesicle protein n=1 Tax=Halalkalibacillus sediminis TaxID=2018042 RepID=A0A2I0QXU4_9BACI|nr:gas vesicle protein [Halalkalibacillus sediminis]PKR79139.1 gas vesicle protein [Halalkalibacillus sediminis]
MDQEPIKQSTDSNSLVDVLETVLDKGVVIAGDIKINLADVELLTIKIRLLVASVDKAKEIGMDWWETDPYFSSKGLEMDEMKQENQRLQEQINRLESQITKKEEDK